MLYKITVRSVIDYGLPVFYYNLKQTEKARIENVQYQAAKGRVKKNSGLFH